MAANSRKPPVLLLLTLLVPGVFLAALLAVVLSLDQKPVIAPMAQYLFAGSVPGIGPAGVFVSLETEHPHLVITPADGQAFVELFGEELDGQLWLADVTWNDGAGVTNVLMLGTVLASPRSFVGSISNAATGRFREFELQPVATYTRFQKTAGLRIAGRGWSMTYSASAPVFDEPTLLERRAMEWAGELTLGQAEEALREWRPGFRDRLRYFVTASATMEWSAEVVWQVDFRSPEILSLREEHYSYTGGAHGNSHTECHNFWIADGEPQRVELADLFQPAANWLPVFKQAVAQRLHMEKQRRQGSDYQAGEPVEFDWEESPPKVTFRPGGIAVYFDPYEVGSYAEGRYRVFVPFADLETVLRSDGVVAVLRKP